MTNPDLQSTTVYLRYRTPRASGSWTETSVTTSSTSGQVDVTGLTATSDYRVQASLDDTFPSSGRQQADFSTTSNTAPDFGATTVTRAVDENSPAGTDVGDPVVAMESDVGDSVTYALSGTDASSFALDTSTGQITVGSGTVLDFESKETYAVTVTATDTHSGTASVAVTINVNDVDEVGLLGRIVFVVGQGSGMASEYYGYESGNFGSLTSGDFPGGLFDDHTLRTVEAIYETANAEWVLEYSGGTADDWLSDEDALDAITVTVTYDDDVNTRAFVLGGFIETVGSNNRMILEPPLPSRDWSNTFDEAGDPVRVRVGDTVTMNFHRHVSQAARIMPASIDASGRDSRGR